MAPIGRKPALRRPIGRLAWVRCPLLAPLVENGELLGPRLGYPLRKYWAETEQTAPGEVNPLLLACTHDPLLFDGIREVEPRGVRVLAQGAIVASSLADCLRRHPEMETRFVRGRSTEFRTSEVSESVDRLAEPFPRHMVGSERVELDREPGVVAGGGSAP
jgi:glutamate racemase